MAERTRPEDRRGEERTDCAVDGRIELPDHSVIACIVKDLSETGARMTISPAAQLPERFDLLVAAVPGADQRFKVRLVWRRGAEIGGEFIPASD